MVEESNTEWLIKRPDPMDGRPEDLPRFAILAAHRRSGQQIPSPFATNMPDYMTHESTFKEFLKLKGTNPVFSAVFLGGAADEYELFSALGYPIKLDYPVPSVQPPSCGQWAS